MRSADVSRIVFSSSCATYGIPPALPIVETTSQNPISPYGRSKRMGEEILRDACAAHGLGAIALRYFNAAGADARGEIGEAHLPETHLIPLVLMAAAGLRPSISIFGTDYDTPDGTCIRDYVHVQDLAVAHVAALSACRPGEFAAYNLGQGNGSSIREVIDCAQRTTKRSINATVEERRAGDPPRLVADAALAKANLAWTPVHSSLENVVETAWKWMTESGSRTTKAA
jgi:UDP-arabinose 4-epimerase